MSLVKEGKLVYPLKQYRVQIGEQVVYNRDTRGKSWFIVDLVIPGKQFIPADSTGLITVDGKILTTHSRYKEVT